MNQTHGSSAIRRARLREVMADGGAGARASVTSTKPSQLGLGGAGAKRSANGPMAEMMRNGGVSSHRVETPTTSST